MTAELIFDRPVLRPFGRDIWELACNWDVEFRDRRYSVPAGTCTDGASIPRCLWRLCGHPLGQPRIYAAIVHDWLYDGGDMEATRADADALYRDMRIELGAWRAVAWIEWLALRMFGWLSWQG